MKEEYVLHGAKPSCPIYRENTGKFIYEKLASRKEDEVLLINDETDEKITCKELLKNSLQLAKTFRNYGMEHDNLIALCSDNHVKYITVVLGALQAGVPIVFINPGYTEHEIQHALNVTKPVMIFCTTPYVNKFLKLKSKNPFIRKIVTIDSNANTAESYSFNKFINQSPSHETTEMEIRQVNVHNHIAFILFSSGTTGLPKGVTLTHLNLNATLAAVLGPEMENDYETAVTVGVLPFFHIFGLFGVLISLCRNRRMVILEKFDPETYLKYIEKYKVAFLVTVPPLIQFFLKNPVVDKYDLSSIKEIVCGAAPLGKD
ncbi:AMP-binding protein, partial [Oryctes borbonicus]